MPAHLIAHLLGVAVLGHALLLLALGLVLHHFAGGIWPPGVYMVFWLLLACQVTAGMLTWPLAPAGGRAWLWALGVALSGCLVGAAAWWQLRPVAAQTMNEDNP
ncbi:hypothetical protein [Chitinibacter tainanensis]|uniref:hypothetical protein n=1 Tax=Chitinibacter tainanensis TaxID=230667 RepID=UPI00040879C9|nr:hypothetical protein [Chitinibacter tainanensis]